MIQVREERAGGAPGNDRRERRVAATIFALLLAASAFFFGGSGFNQNSTFDLTRALVEQHSIRIDTFASNTRDVSTSGGHLYVNKAPGLSFLAAIPYALMPRPHEVRTANIELYLCTVAICGSSAAWIGVLLFTAARSLGSHLPTAAGLAMIGVLATPMFPWSTLLFAHLPSAALTLFAFLALSGLAKRRPLAAGAALGLASTMNYLCIVVAALFALLLLATSTRRMRELWLYIAGGAPFAAALMWYQQVAFGSWMQTPVATEDPRYLTHGAWMGVFTMPDPYALWGITFSPYRGLFYLCPLLLLAFPGAMLLRHRAGLRPALVTAIATISFYFLFNASFNGWFAGYSIGPRYLVPVVPLIYLLAMSALSRLRPLWIVTAVISLSLSIVVTAVDPQPPEQILDPIGHYELPALLTGHPSSSNDVPRWVRDFYIGHTSTNRVTVDDGTPFRRHAVRSAAVEWASFNLGELITAPGSPWSLLPFAVLMTCGVLLLRRTTA